MTRFFGAGGASAIATSCMLAIGGATPAAAEVATAATTPLVTTAYSIAKPATTVSVSLPATGTPSVAILPSARSLPASGVTSPPSNAVPVRPAVSHETLWPLIWANLQGAPLDEEMNCVATAVYFEARGEQIEGQLAVAEVVLNRVASKRYPDTICEVVEQPWQFSFVNATGSIPEADRSSKAWKKAVAISTIALDKLAGEVSEDVLWYHADYVAPSWGKRLDREKKVGVHIFYS